MIAAAAAAIDTLCQLTPRLRLFHFAAAMISLLFTLMLLIFATIADAMPTLLFTFSLATTPFYAALPQRHDDALRYAALHADTLMRAARARCHS